MVSLSYLLILIQIQYSVRLGGTIKAKLNIAQNPKDILILKYPATRTQFAGRTLC
jgi:hypothetical protein